MVVVVSMLQLMLVVLWRSSLRSIILKSIGTVAVMGSRSILHQIMTTIGTWCVVTRYWMMGAIEISSSARLWRCWLRREWIRRRILVWTGSSVMS
jgi:hypothetical protein